MPYARRRELAVTIPIHRNGLKDSGTFQSWERILFFVHFSRRFIISYQKNSYLIIGIGINLNENPIIKEKITTSLRQELNKIIDKKTFIKYLVKAYEKFFFNIKTYDFSVYKNKSKILATNKV